MGRGRHRGNSAQLIEQERVVLGASPAASGQVRDLRLRSTVWPDLDRHARAPLPVGIADTAKDVARHLRNP